MSQPIFIAAYNLAHARDWARSHEIQARNWRFVSDDTSLKGFHGVVVIVLDTFWNRKDSEELQREIKLARLE